jgi:hypothetical protein
MLIGAALVVSLIAGLAAAIFARRLPPRSGAALALCAAPPLGLYYLLGSC